MQELIIANLICLLAAVVYGTTGFGFGLVSIPVLAQILAPAVVVPLVTLIALPLSLALAVGTRRSIRRRLFLPLVLGAIVGIPAGVLLLRLLPPTSMKVLVGLLVAAAAALLLTGRRRPLPDRHLSTFTTGGLAGVLGAAMGIPGPPILLFLANQGEPKEIHRANLIAFFCVSNLLTLVGYGIGGLLDREVLLLAAQLGPITLIGIGAGALVAHRLGDEIFRRASLVLVLVAGMALVVSAVAYTE